MAATHFRGSRISQVQGANRQGWIRLHAAAPNAPSHSTRADERLDSKTRTALLDRFRIARKVDNAADDPDHAERDR